MFSRLRHYIEAVSSSARLIPQRNLFDQVILNEIYEKIEEDVKEQVQPSCVTQLLGESLAIWEERFRKQDSRGWISRLLDPHKLRKQRERERFCLALLFNFKRSHGLADSPDKQALIAKLIYHTQYISSASLLNHHQLQKYYRETSMQRVVKAENQVILSTSVGHASSTPSKPSKPWGFLSSFLSSLIPQELVRSLTDKSNSEEKQEKKNINPSLSTFLQVIETEKKKLNENLPLLFNHHAMRSAYHLLEQGRQKIQAAYEHLQTELTSEMNKIEANKEESNSIPLKELSLILLKGKVYSAYLSWQNEVDLEERKFKKLFPAFIPTTTQKKSRHSNLGLSERWNQDKAEITAFMEEALAGLKKITHRDAYVKESQLVLQELNAKKKTLVLIYHEDRVTCKADKDLANVIFPQMTELFEGYEKDLNPNRFSESTSMAFHEARQKRNEEDQLETKIANLERQTKATKQTIQRQFAEMREAFKVNPQPSERKAEEPAGKRQHDEMKEEWDNVKKRLSEYIAGNGQDPEKRKGQVSSSGIFGGQTVKNEGCVSGLPRVDNQLVF